MPRLKVYRTAIGFHDAYVAAPSQKAALAAWGVDKNLFARGAAEVVDDPALTKEPLAHPGKVIRKSRGSLAEQLRALGPAKRSPAPAARAAEEPPPRVKPKRQKKRPPAPSRANIEAAEAAMAAARATADEELAALRRREQRLAGERRALERKHDERERKLAAKLETAREAYQAAFEAWSADIAEDYA
jgi:hypothetical protein